MTALSLLAVHEGIPGKDLKEAATRWDHLEGFNRRREVFQQIGRRTDGSWRIVSLYAVFDTDLVLLHRSLLSLGARAAPPIEEHPPAVYSFFRLPANHFLGPPRIRPTLMRCRVGAIVFTWQQNTRTLRKRQTDATARLRTRSLRLRQADRKMAGPGIPSVGLSGLGADFWLPRPLLSAR